MLHKHEFSQSSYLGWHGCFAFPSGWLKVGNFYYIQGKDSSNYEPHGFLTE